MKTTGTNNQGTKRKAPPSGSSSHSEWHARPRISNQVQEQEKKQRQKKALAELVAKRKQRQEKQQLATTSVTETKSDLEKLSEYIMGNILEKIHEKRNIIGDVHTITLPSNNVINTDTDILFKEGRAKKNLRYGDLSSQIYMLVIDGYAQEYKQKYTQMEKTDKIALTTFIAKDLKENYELRFKKKSGNTIITLNNQQFRETLSKALKHATNNDIIAWALIYEDTRIIKEALPEYLKLRTKHNDNTSSKKYKAEHEQFISNIQNRISENRDKLILPQENKDIPTAKTIKADIRSLNDRNKL